MLKVGGGRRGFRRHTPIERLVDGDAHPVIQSKHRWPELRNLVQNPGGGNEHSACLTGPVVEVGRSHQDGGYVRAEFERSGDAAPCLAGFAMFENGFAEIAPAVGRSGIPCHGSFE